MKVNLLVNSPHFHRNGYLNIDPFAKDGDQHRVRGDVSNLDALVDDGEAEEIVAYEILDLFPFRDGGTILNNWLKKLKKGGTIVLTSLDILSVAKDLHFGNLEYDHKMIYGNQTANWDFRKASYPLRELVAELKERGLKIIKQRIDNYKAVVVAERLN